MSERMRPALFVVSWRWLAYPVCIILLFSWLGCGPSTISEYTFAIKDDPHNPKLLCGAAYTYLKADKLAESITLFRKAVYEDRIANKSKLSERFLEKMMNTYIKKKTQNLVIAATGAAIASQYLSSKYAEKIRSSDPLVSVQHMEKSEAAIGMRDLQLAILVDYSRADELSQRKMGIFGLKEFALTVVTHANLLAQLQEHLKEIADSDPNPEVCELAQNAVEELNQAIAKEAERVQGDSLTREKKQ